MTLSESLAACTAVGDVDGVTLAYDVMGKLDTPTRQAIAYRRAEILKAEHRGKR